MPDPDQIERIKGCLLGTAVGDALGLPMEGLSRRRRARMFPDLSGYHFLFGRGMVSDDTEHAVMTAQSLAASGGDEDRFARDLAWRLRFWIARLPAGIGFATLRALVKLWVGFSPDKSGVFSAGNGPAMRAPIMGVSFGDDHEKMRRLVRISTRMTHCDPKAEYGALAAALAAHQSSLGLTDSYEFVDELAELLGPEGFEMVDLARRAADSAAAGESTAVFADSLGLAKGVTGYMNHTMPAVLHAWFRYPADLGGALREVIACGGDTDTTAAILGGIVGAGVGRPGIPDGLLDGLMEWPLTVSFIESVGVSLSEAVRLKAAVRPPRPSVTGLYARNLLFTAAVLAHGFRRLLPPY